jgi:hypothetical protein
VFREQIKKQLAIVSSSPAITYVSDGRSEVGCRDCAHSISLMSETAPEADGAITPKCALAYRISKRRRERCEILAVVLGIGQKMGGPATRALVRSWRVAAAPWCSSPTNASVARRGRQADAGSRR